MVTDEMKARAQSISIVGLAERRGVVLHPHGAKGELAGPCPVPGCKAGKDGFHVLPGNRWLCHSCESAGRIEAGKQHDAIELVKLIEGLNYPAAVQRLMGGSTPTLRTAQQAQPVQQQTKGWDAARSAETLAKAQVQLLPQNASDDGPLGRRAWAYLEGRGLDSATWFNFRLGVANVKTGVGSYAPAVCLPWFVRGELVSLAWRFLEPQGEQRYTRWGSAANRLFGNHANIEPASTLVICEGEINCASVWQIAQHTRSHVLSTGKQVNRLPDAAVRAIAARYSTVIVWADEPEITRSLQAQIAAQARGIVGAMFSPVQDGTKLDANALLQRGELGAKLAAYRLSLALEQQQLDRLYSDLLHGAMSLQGLDTGSADVLQRLAARVNMPLDLQQPESNRWIVFR